MKSRLLFVLGLLILLPVWPSAAAEPELKIDLGKGVSLEMVLVKKGQFKQGSPETEGGRGSDETQRDVTLTKSFYMAKYPVTVAQFRRFVEDQGYVTEAEQGSSGGFGLVDDKLVQRKDFSWKNPGYEIKDDCPVTMVTYDDAFAFVYWLRDKSDRKFKFTLPTEAQWEYACRADTTTPLYNGSGDTDLDAIGWYSGNSNKSAQPVGKKKPNAWGLYDMSGNVFEWCRDWYGPYGDDTTDPLQTRSNLIEKQPPRRVLRGGSWFKSAKYCRSAARWRSTAASRNADNGMRVMCEVEDDAASDDAKKSSRAEPSRPHEIEARRASDHTLPPAPRVVEGSIFGILCVLVVIVIVVLVIRAMMSAMSGPRQWPPQQPQQPQQPWPQTPPPRPSPGMPFHIEPAADGFWIHPVGVPVGSVIHYRYHTFGTPRESTAMVETGGRQFIYTGDMPADIMITNIVPPSGTSDSDPTWQWSQQTGGGTSTSTDYPTSRPSQPEDTSVSGGDFEGPSQAADESRSAPSGGYPAAY